MAREHHFAAHLVWTGAAQGVDQPTRRTRAPFGPRSRASRRSRAPSDPTFRGDASRYNPEDLLVVSLSACHMLSYLYLCASAGIEVVAYEDRATGTMAIKDRKMRFVDVLLAPRVTIAKGDREKARPCTSRRTRPASSPARSTFRYATKPWSSIGADADGRARICRLGPPQ